MPILADTPRLIVTCREPNPEPCEHEIGNVLFPKDPDVYIVKSKYPGVLLVYSNLTTERAYAVTSLREYGYVENIIPVQCVLRHPIVEEELERCIHNIDLSKDVKIRVRSRGVRGISAIIYHKVIDMIRTKGVKINSHSQYCLFVEIIDQYVYIGHGLCQSVFKGSHLRLVK